MRCARACLAALLLGALVGCHESAVERIDIHANHTATVTITSVTDRQLYEFASAMSATNPFENIEPRHAGWTIVSSTDAHGDFVVRATKIVPVAQVWTMLPGGSGRYFANATVHPSISRKSMFFSTTTHVHFVLPPAVGTHDVGNDVAQAAQIVRLRFEITTPGTIVTTNGIRMPDGVMRWNDDLLHPTVVDYRVRTLRVARIVAAAGLAFVLLLLAITLGKRRKSAVRSRAPLV